MDASKKLESLVIKHFEDYQRGGDEGDRMRRGIADASVESRVTFLREQIGAFLLSESVSNISLQDESKDDYDSPLHRITSAVLQCVDAAIATEISRDSQEPVERILALAACLCSREGHFMKALVARAVQFSAVIMERVRVQACKLLGLCVKYLQEQNAVGKKDDGLFSLDIGDNDSCRNECVKVARQALRTRLMDKSQAVRNAAITSCASFFGPNVEELDEDEYELLDSLLWNMSHDPSVANRLAALQSVPMSDITAEAVIARVRDVKVKVRVEALRILRSKMQGNTLSPEQYAELVRSGLTDRCKATCEAATRLICAGWMKTVRYDPIALLGLLDPVINEPECVKVAQVILDVAADAESTSVPAVLDELSDPEIRAFKEGVSSTVTLLRTNADAYLEPRAVLFARIKCDRTNTSSSFSEARKADIIGKIVPDIPILCETLQMHITRLVESIAATSDEEDSETLQDHDIFVCSQLLQMAQASDLMEEGSRRHFISVMKNLVKAIETPDDLLEGCLKAMKFAHEHERTFLQAISDLVSELSTVSTQDNTSIMEEVMRIRIISILAITLENTGARMASDSSMGNFATHIIPAVTSSHALIREGGVSCLGRLAILSDRKTVLEEFKPLLLSVASNAEEKLEIRAQAMMAICDLSFVFDEMLSPCILSSNNNAKPKEVVFASLLSDMIRTSKPAVVAVAAEVAAKLLFSGRTFDCNLVADLVVTYFDQDLANLASEVEDDVTEIGSPVRMQQLLSLFFPAYSTKSADCRSSLIASIGPMLAAVSTKLSKKGAKVSDWPIGRIVEYIDSVLDTGSHQNGQEFSPSSEHTADQNQHDKEPSNQQEPSSVIRMGIEIAQFLVKEHADLKTTFSRQLCKFLGALNIDIDSDDTSSLSMLKKSLDELEMLITDATALRSLKPIMELLDNPNADDDESDGESTGTGASSLAEALQAIEIAERESLEIAKENEEGEQVTGKDSDVQSSRSRRRLASVNYQV